MAALDLALEPLAGSRSRRILYIVDGENALTRNVKSISDVHRVGNIETTEAEAIEHEEWEEGKGPTHPSPPDPLSQRGEPQREPWLLSLTGKKQLAALMQHSIRIGSETERQRDRET